MNKQHRGTHTFRLNCFWHSTGLLMTPRGPKRNQTPSKSGSVWTDVLFWLNFPCTDDFPSVTATTQELNMSTRGKSTVCQLAEPGTLFSVRVANTLCDPGTGVFSHQDLLPNKITISTLSLWFSVCVSCRSLLSLSGFSSAFPLCLSLSLHLFFFPSLCSAHFSRTPFPPGSQATKYSDWCRQLGLITNGKQSREEQRCWRWWQR